MSKDNFKDGDIVKGKGFIFQKMGSDWYVWFCGTTTQKMLWATVREQNPVLITNVRELAELMEQQGVFDE